MTATASVSEAVTVDDIRTAVAAVNDPEYPDVSIVDLGLLESIDIARHEAADHEAANHEAANHEADDEVDVGVGVTVGLIPTFSGCPALDMIANDVAAAVMSLADVARCDVVWLSGPVWSTGRLTTRAQSRLADDYTVVLRRKDGTLRCPVCGSDAVADQSMAGPTRCRSIAWCDSCRNPVEVMR